MGITSMEIPGRNRGTRGPSEGVGSGLRIGVGGIDCGATAELAGLPKRAPAGVSVIPWPAATLCYHRVVALQTEKKFR
jgi:hypothetical protein